MGTVVRVPFQVTGWEPVPLSLGEGGPVVFGRVTLRTSFSGDLAGSSVVAMTSVALGDAPHRVRRRRARDRQTGTGELTGLRGAMTISHDDTGAVLVLDYELG